MTPHTYVRTVRTNVCKNNIENNLPGGMFW